jgi:hypothetical protein
MWFAVGGRTWCGSCWVGPAPGGWARTGVGGVTRPAAFAMISSATLRDLGVGVELHGVAGPALGLGPQVADVAEHLRQRHQGLDDAGAAALLHGLDLATAGVEVADDVAHVVLGRDVTSTAIIGSSSTGSGLAGGLLERHRAGDLERHLGGVDVVVGAVDERHLDVDHRVAGEDAVLHGLLDAGVDRGDVLLGDAATGDLVDELVAPPPSGSRQVGSRSMTTLANWPDHRSASCGCSRPSRRLRDRLAVGDLRLADVGLDLELALHAVDEHLEVQLAHAGDDRLAGLLVGADRKVGSSSASAGSRCRASPGRPWSWARWRRG